MICFCSPEQDVLTGVCDLLNELKLSYDVNLQNLDDAAAADADDAAANGGGGDREAAAMPVNFHVHFTSDTIQVATIVK